MIREPLGQPSNRVTTVTRLFVATAAIELGAALALLVAPAVVIKLVFGSAADVFPAAGIARLTRAVVVLGLAGALGPLGPLLWAAVVLHGAQAIWCAWVVADRRR